MIFEFEGIETAMTADGMRRLAQLVATGAAATTGLPLAERMVIGVEVAHGSALEKLAQLVEQQQEQIDLLQRELNELRDGK